MVKTMNNNIKEHPIQFEADMIRALLQEYSTKINPAARAA